MNKDRGEKKIAELTELKLESREKLRAARLEISKLDSQLLKVGARLNDLGAVCW
ncbi:hypothetical protein SAMN05216228_11092 [Rhizobium tibeticum]|uniref:Transposase n=1 Tax=Rhizobium tibeticum TaxID=501024 RepID=A0ABY1AYZ7_9HYPH|nr:hypothetical protein [Rhizobium tibeticum]SEP35635.1 hypothetical protein SAMN05216228_11092 [Rhizobium tibeticum]